MQKPKIDSIRLVVKHDDSPDTSFLGEFTDDCGDWVIDRLEGDFVANLGKDFEPCRSSREYRFFRPYAGGEPEGSKDFQKYGLEDWRRMEALNRGDWQFIGIYAEATVSYAESSDSSIRRLERFTSGGIWGIESDSDDDFLKEQASVELENLKTHLARFNVNLENWQLLVVDLVTDFDLSQAVEY